MDVSKPPLRQEEHPQKWIQEDSTIAQCIGNGPRVDAMMFNHLRYFQYYYLIVLKISGSSKDVRFF